MFLTLTIIWSFVVCIYKDDCLVIKIALSTLQIIGILMTFFFSKLRILQLMFVIIFEFASV